MNRVLNSAAVVLALAFLSGCGGSELGCVPVSGTVTFGDGVKLDQYAIKNISLEPIDIANGERRASSSINPDGTFSMMTMKPDDGAVPGKYKVIADLKHYPPIPSDATAVWVVEPETVEVTSGMDPLNVKISKKK